EQRGCERPGDDIRDIEDFEAFERAAHATPRPLLFSPSMSFAVKPQSCSACPPPTPRSGGAPRIAPGVRDKRGAGEGWSTSPACVNVLRWALCGCARASVKVRTGAKQASEPSNAAHHSSRVFDLNFSENFFLRAGQPLRSCCDGRSFAFKFNFKSNSS